MHCEVRRAGVWPAAALLAALCSLAPVTGAAAQAPTSLAEARRARESGDLAAAARLLRAYLITRPDDGEAARLLAETLYWLHDIPAARAVYEGALERHPQDTAAKLQYARMLAETGDRGRARGLLLPLGQLPAVQAEANALLGTIAYWDGDLTSARRLFEEALRVNSGHAEAGRQLREILAMTRPWLRFGVGRHEDDQPLEHVGTELHAQWFITPLSPVSVRMDARDYSTVSSASRRIWTGEIAMSRFIPTARLDTEVRGAVHRRPTDASPHSWSGAAGLGVRLPGHFRLRGRIERAPYRHTVSSLDTPIFARTTIALGQWLHPRGWSAEGSYRQHRYGDGNRVTSAYGWLLAPVMFRPQARLSAGYAFLREHSSESRFVLAHASQPVPIGDLQFDTSGRYAPYHTPNRLNKHSMVFSGVAFSRRGLAVRANGSVAIRATDEHPFFFVSGTEVLRAFFPRTFRPRDVTVSVDVPIGPAAVLSVTGDAGRSAFYGWSNVGVQFTYHLRPGPAASAAR